MTDTNCNGKKQNFYSYENIIDTLFDQKSPAHQEAGFPQWNKQTTYGHCDLETESANSVKTP